MTFDQFLGQFNDEYTYTHQKRLLESFNIIQKYLLPNHHILELGGQSRIIEYLQSENYSTQTSNEDLRYPLSIPDNSADFIIFTETIEHLKDRDEDNQDVEGRAIWTYSGVKTCLAEIYRILKPNGYLFLSTPNANSTLALERLLKFQHPSNYRPHPREFTIGELKQLLHQFNVVLTSTTFSWHQNYKQFLSIIRSAGYNTADRGDNIFILAKK